MWKFIFLFSTSYINRNRIGAELHVQRGIKIVDGLDQADAADLKQIVNIFVAGRKAFDHAQDKS